MPTPAVGEDIDLSDLITLANAKIVPQYYEKENSDVITGTFAVPSVNDLTPRAWGDEMDRIWCSLFDKYQDHEAPNTYSMFTGSLNATDMDYIHAILDYWWDEAAVSGTPRKTVVSCGPHLWTHSNEGIYKTGTTERRVLAFREPQLIFSKLDSPVFRVKSGFLVGTISNPYVASGDAAEHPESSPASVTFPYALPSAILFGEIRAVFRDGTEDPTGGFFGFTGWGTGGASNSGFAVGDEWHMTLLSPSGGMAELIDNSGSGFASGTLSFNFWLGDATDAGEGFGWVFDRFEFTGIVHTMLGSELVSDTDATTTDYSVIHPRNEAMRDEAHIGQDPHIVNPDDYLDLNGFILLLKANTYPPAVYLNSQWDNDPDDLLTWISEYPGGANDGSIAGLLTLQLNEIIIDGPNLVTASSGAWDSVTLRDITQFLVDLDPPAGPLREKMNRLLLEDAFGDYIRRLPPPIVTPELEIEQLDLPEITTDGGLDGPYYFEHHLPGHLVVIDSDNSLDPDLLVAGVWVADAWPQPIKHTFLDFDLPQYYSDDAASATKTSLNTAHTGEDIATISPFKRNQPAMWPIMPVANYGAFHYAAIDALTGQTLARQPYVAPYWSACEEHQTWEAYPGGTVRIANNESQNFSYFVPDNDGNAMREKQRVEFGLFNNDVELYVGITSQPDPDNPATYLASSTSGVVVYPDDFPGSPDPLTISGQNFFFTARNASGSTQTIRPMVSNFFSQVGEDPPHPEPIFIPRESNYVADKFATDLEPVYSASDIASYRFTSQSDSGQDKAFPRPDRGYCVHGINLRRKPITNAAGIHVPATDLSAAIVVKIGIMAGCGVIAGATTGVFPGRFIEFDELTIPIDSLELRQEVFWPVLEGCPLAYSVVTEDAEVMISAAVDFQPAVNVGFLARTVTPTGSGSIPTDFRVGQYSGKPELLEHFLWERNRNNGGAYPSFFTFPPVSAACVNDLMYWLDLLPDL